MKTFGGYERQQPAHTHAHTHMHARTSQFFRDPRENCTFNFQSPNCIRTALLSSPLSRFPLCCPGTFKGLLHGALRLHWALPFFSISYFLCHSQSLFFVHLAVFIVFSSPCSIILLFILLHFSFCPFTSISESTTLPPFISIICHLSAISHFLHYLIFTVRCH